jgi:hypothetical protein
LLIATRRSSLRIIDEGGKDYLYHKSHFVFVDFPPAMKIAGFGVEKRGGTSGQAIFMVSGCRLAA